MEREYGVPWIYGTDERYTLACTDFRVGSLAQRIADLGRSPARPCVALARWTRR